MIWKDTFNEITDGDVIVSIGDKSQDYETHILRVDRIDYDCEYASEEDDKGKICYCSDLHNFDCVEVTAKNYLEHLNGDSILTDKDVEQIWCGLEDIPMNPDTECLEASYFVFPCGINRMKIWKWFDEHHSKGVHYLLYGENLET